MMYNSKYGYDIMVLVMNENHVIPTKWKKVECKYY